MRSTDIYNIEEYINETEYTQFSILETIKKEENYIEIYKDLIPTLLQVIKPNVIYNAIYNIKELKNELYLLLSDTRFDIKTLTNNHIKELLTTVTTTHFLYNNLSMLMQNVDLSKIIRKLETEDDEVIKKVVNSLNSEDRVWILKLLHKNPFTTDEFFFENRLQLSFLDNEYFNISEEETIAMVNFLISTKTPLSDVVSLIDKLITINPSLNFGFILHQYFFNPTFEDYIKLNIEKIIPNCKEYSIRIIELVNDKEILKKYAELLRLSRLAKAKNNAIEHLVAQNGQDLAKSLITKYLDLSKNKEFSFLGSGQTTTTFRVGDYSLKVSSYKYTKTCPRNFRIIKTIERIILKDELEIEIQKYIPAKEISEDDIFELLLDFKNNGLEVTDPLILKFKNNNFGYLEDLADCDVDDINTLSPHFIERPLVIYDKDLIYLKKDKNKKYFSDSFLNMDDLIDGYKKIYKKKTN